MHPYEQDYEKCTTRHMQGKKFDLQRFTPFLAAGTKKLCGVSVTAEQVLPQTI